MRTAVWAPPPSRRGAPASPPVRSDSGPFTLECVETHSMDLHESAEEYVVTVEIPGAGKDDVTVEVDQGVLNISGEKKSERDEKEEGRRYVERSFGAFRRSFRLPSDALSDQIGASFKDGVLTITIPKAEESKPRVVALK